MNKKEIVESLRSHVAGSCLKCEVSGHERNGLGCIDTLMALAANFIEQHCPEDAQGCYFSEEEAAEYGEGSKHGKAEQTDSGA